MCQTDVPDPKRSLLRGNVLRYRMGNCRPNYLDATLREPVFANSFRCRRRIAIGALA